MHIFVLNTFQRKKLMNFEMGRTRRILDLSKRTNEVFREHVKDVSQFTQGIILIQKQMFLIKAVYFLINQ